MNNSELARKFGMGESTLRTRIKREGWQRDLSESVRLEREDIMRRQLVKDAEESGLITAEAGLQSRVLVQEREEIDRLCDAARDAEDELIKLLQEYRVTTNKDRLLELDKASGVLKKVVESRKILIDMRRRNYGINDNANGDANKQKEVVIAPTTDYLNSLVSRLNAAG
ncbi:hypothetical protein [Methylomicrobium agile]|uniref:hypothetical protein n=1 Tax=Methylomicrobium agile TaxID=39774 RepID=UPI0014702E3F|nr:hypothetical protein [Methylomicrobium agile]